VLGRTRRRWACALLAVAAPIAGCGLGKHEPPSGPLWPGVSDGATLVQACTTCHALADAGSTSSTGPDLDRVIPGQPAARVRASIVDPAARVTPGYENLMPTTFAREFTPRQIDALVRYLRRVAGSIPPAGVIRVRSRDFSDGGMLNERFTCDDEDVSPELFWDGIPRASAEVVLVVDDTDAANATHWSAYRISPGADGSGFNHPPDGALQGKNFKGDEEWAGPCPPRGDPPHHYRFTVTALARTTGLAKGASPADVQAAIRRSGPLASGTIVVRYAR